jgi:hypothetical protein
MAIATLTTIAITAAVVAATATTVGGIMAAEQQQQQADIAEFNQKLALRNAEQANLNAAAAEKRANAAAEAEQNEYARKEQLAREQARKQMALNAALMGASGVESTSGSSLLVTVDNAIAAELNALEVRREGQNRADQIRYEGALNAFENRMQAASFMGEASNYKMQKKAAKTNKAWTIAATPVNALASGLSAGASIYGAGK